MNRAAVELGDAAVRRFVPVMVPVLLAIRDIGEYLSLTTTL